MVRMSFIFFIGSLIVDNIIVMVIRLVDGILVVLMVVVVVVKLWNISK